MTGDQNLLESIMDATLLRASASRLSDRSVSPFRDAGFQAAGSFAANGSSEAVRNSQVHGRARKADIGQVDDGYDEPAPRQLPRKGSHNGTLRCLGQGRRINGCRRGAF